MAQSTTHLTKKKCIPCEGGTPALTAEQIRQYQSQLRIPWTVMENNRISREWTLKNFHQAMQFVQRVAEIAEEEGHHPDIDIAYNKVRLTLWTHAIGGLSENDFILAAKIEQCAA